MSTYLERKILEGEHLHQDFKYAINDSKKIARSLAAFANTDGGRLLVGVKDNGSIAGVSSDEEYYMIEAAACMYCKPEVVFSTKEWKTKSGKIVLEVIIPKSDKKPHSAPNKDGKYMVYIRVNDQNLLANNVLLKVWQREKKDKGTYIALNDAEKFILDYLANHENITHTQFKKLAKISYFKAEKILVNFVSLKLLKIVFTENQTYYELGDASINE